MAYPDYTNNFDTKWKDQSTPCEYDVDDPTFCSPMSVISGLVSGFCERQAVVNSSFVTGTTASPVTSDWFAATDAGRSDIVNSCVQHVVCHDLKPSEVGAESYKGPVDGSFHAVDHASVSDGGTTKVTTYMTHMDGLIDSLVQTGEYTTDITGGTAYTTFEQLASSASSGASSAGSAITSVPVYGGTNYSQDFMPAFPKEWAKERKWMLEQLRFTMKQSALEPAEPDLTCAHKYVSQVSAGTYDAIVSACCNRPLVTYADGQYYAGLSEAHVALQHKLGRLTCLTVEKDGNNLWSAIAGNCCTNYPVLPQSAIDSGIATIGIDNAAIRIDGGQYVPQTTVDMYAYYAQDGLYKDNDTNIGSGDFSYENCLHIVSSGITSTASGTLDNDEVYTSVFCYKVLSGGRLEVPASTHPYAILVSNGGIVSFGSATSVETCIVLPGGILQGCPTVKGWLSCDNFYPLVEDQNIDYGYSFPARMTVSRKTVYSVVSTTAVYNQSIHGSAVCVVAGGSLFISSGSHPLEAVIVQNGGKVIISGAAGNSASFTDADFLVHSGGVLSFTDLYELDQCRLLVYPGGSSYIYRNANTNGINGYSRMQFAANSFLTIDIVDDSYIGAQCAFHFEPGCLNTVESTGKPIITATSNGVTWVGPICAGAAVACIFNNFGLRMTGAQHGIQPGDNAAHTILPILQGTSSGYTFSGGIIGYYDSNSLAIPATEDADGASFPAYCVDTGNKKMIVLRSCPVDFTITSNSITVIDNYTTFKLRQNAT